MMPAIAPGMRSAATKAARVVMTVTESAPSATVELVEGPVRLRRDPRGRSVLESSGAGSTTVALAAAPGSGGRMAGTARIELKTIPVPGEGTGATVFTVSDVFLEGRSRLEVLRIECEEEHFWAFRNLTSPAPPARGPAPARAESGGNSLTKELRHLWGDRPPLRRRTLVAVDRSASMTWAFAPEGALHELIGGVSAVGQVALDQTQYPVTADAITWVTFGSGASSRDAISAPTANPTVADLRPVLFSSAAAPEVAIEHARRFGFDEVVLVTDRPEAAGRALAGAERSENPEAVVVALGTSERRSDWPAAIGAAAQSVHETGAELVPVAEVDYGPKVARALAARWSAIAEEVRPA